MWVVADAVLALCKDTILPVPMLNILSPKLLDLPISFHLQDNLELFAIIPRMPVKNEKKVGEESLWYRHEYIAMPLFTELDLELV